MAHFEYSSVINFPKKDVFAFFSDINNVLKITPPEFKVEFTAPIPKFKKGAEVELKVGRFGISMPFHVLIEDIQDMVSFRDRQTNGPFTVWIHTHRFEDHAEGTVLTDVIEYDLPYGLFGKLADDVIVSRELNKLFEYRHKKTSELLAGLHPKK